MRWRIEIEFVRRPMQDALQATAEHRGAGEHAYISQLPPEVRHRNADAIARTIIEPRPDNSDQQHQQDRRNPGTIGEKIPCPVPIDFPQAPCTPNDPHQPQKAQRGQLTEQREQCLQQLAKRLEYRGILHSVHDESLFSFFKTTRRRRRRSIRLAVGMEVGNQTLGDCVPGTYHGLQSNSSTTLCVVEPTTTTTRSVVLH